MTCEDIGEGARGLTKYGRRLTRAGLAWSVMYTATAAASGESSVAIGPLGKGRVTAPGQHGAHSPADIESWAVCPLASSSQSHTRHSERDCGRSCSAGFERYVR